MTFFFNFAKLLPLLLSFINQVNMFDFPLLDLVCVFVWYIRKKPWPYHVGTWHIIKRVTSHQLDQSNHHCNIYIVANYCHFQVSPLSIHITAVLLECMLASNFTKMPNRRLHQCACNWWYLCKADWLKTQRKWSIDFVFYIQCENN